MNVFELPLRICSDLRKLQRAAGVAVNMTEYIFFLIDVFP